MPTNNELLKILGSARQMLEFARVGEKDFRAAGDRRVSGLYNAVTSGRSVTFVLQKLRKKATGFDDWYQVIQKQLQADVIARWFVDMRNQMEKEGTHGDASYTLHVESFSTDELERPLNATGMFIGDNLGRSGWNVSLPDGSESKIYFRIPNSDLGMYITSAPDDRPVEDSLAYWLDMLEAVLSDAEREFGTP